MNHQEKSSAVVLEYEQKWVDGLNAGNVSVADEVFHPDSRPICFDIIRNFKLDARRNRLGGVNFYTEIITFDSEMN